MRNALVVPNAALVAAACFFGLAGCSVIDSTTGGASTAEESIVPDDVNATYRVDIHLGEGHASCFAQYVRGDLLTGSSVDLTGGETIACNGVPLDEQAFIGVSYGASVPLANPGDEYVFELGVPSDRTYRTSIVAVAPTMLISPTDDTTLSIDTDTTIRWASPQDDVVDEIHIAFEPNGDGALATEDFEASDGASSVTLSAASLHTLYDEASGGAGGSVLATLTLKRRRQADLGEPFTGGSIAVEAELDQIAVWFAP